MAEARKEAGTILQQAKQAAEVDPLRGCRQGAGRDTTTCSPRLARRSRARSVPPSPSCRRSVADLSVAVAGKLIGAELSKEDHLKVIEKYVSEAGSLNAN